MLQWTEIEATYANTNVLISSVINVPTRVLNGVAIGIIGANGNVKKALDWIPRAERITSGDYTTGIECSVHSPSGTFTSTTKQTIGVLLIGTID